MVSLITGIRCLASSVRIPKPLANSEGRFVHKTDSSGHIQRAPRSVDNIAFQADGDVECLIIGREPQRTPARLIDIDNGVDISPDDGPMVTLLQTVPRGPPWSCTDGKRFAGKEFGYNVRALAPRPKFLNVVCPIHNDGY